jgi:hypothetical protein
LTAPLIIRFRHTAALCAAVLLLHLLAGACAVVALSGLSLALVVAGIGLSAIAHLRVLRLKGQAAIAEAACHVDGRLELAGPADEARTPATLEQGAVLAPWLAVLSARDHAGRRRMLTVTSGSAHADDLRRLRVWLRWHRARAGHSPH